MEKELFNDLIESCKEVIEFQKGNVQLKTTEVEISDDEIKFYNMYRNLSESNKIKAINYVNELLQA